ncbi:hypothetical protein ACU4GD_22780 [Cupriavidus basilensis]
MEPVAPRYLAGPCLLIGLVLGAADAPQWRMVFSASAVAGAFVCSRRWITGVVFGF